jgi:hypothetical protein
LELGGKRRRRIRRMEMLYVVVIFKGVLTHPAATPTHKYTSC